MFSKILKCSLICSLSPEFIFPDCRLLNLYAVLQIRPRQTSVCYLASFIAFKFYKKSLSQVSWDHIYFSQPCHINTRICHTLTCIHRTSCNCPLAYGGNICFLVLARGIPSCFIKFPNTFQNFVFRWFSSVGLPGYRLVLTTPWISSKFCFVKNENNY